MQSSTKLDYRQERKKCTYTDRKYKRKEKTKGRKERKKKQEKRDRNKKRIKQTKKNNNNYNGNSSLLIIVAIQFNLKSYKLSCVHRNNIFHTQNYAIIIKQFLRRCRLITAVTMNLGMKTKFQTKYI